ncbi:DNA gyrase inhibitor YacG, partial [Escherichia coli]|nr:DNA gyrase inhibitor YacG [Escherichia coli]
MSETITVNCPTCGKTGVWGELSPFRPFCPKLGTLMDLGKGPREKKKPPGGGVFFYIKREFFGFRFLLESVVDKQWIEFFQFQFFRLSTFVLRSGI